MLETLKIKDWKQIVPFKHYLSPLEESLGEVRTELMGMYKKGPLFMAYIIELNKDLRDKIDSMLKKDKKSQLLVGNSLKQDQFKFFYDTTKIIYDSVLRNQLINGEDRVIKDVIPLLIAFKAVLHIRDIQLAKAADELKEKEKAARNPKKEQAPEEEKDPLTMTEEELVAKRLKDEAQPDEGELTED